MRFEPPWDHLKFAASGDVGGSGDYEVTPLRADDAARSSRPGQIER